MTSSCRPEHFQIQSCYFKVNQITSSRPKNDNHRVKVKKWWLTSRPTTKGHNSRMSISFEKLSVIVSSVAHCQGSLASVARRFTKHWPAKTKPWRLSCATTAAGTETKMKYKTHPNSSTTWSFDN